MRRSRPSGTAGVLRVDARAARLTPRLQRGDIAVLDEVDLDAATASVLVARGVVAVVNAGPGSSGRYPNLGPGVLVHAGVPVLVDVGPEVLTTLRDGRAARLDADQLLVDDEVVARGTRLDEDAVSSAASLARPGVVAQLADLAANAATFVVDERELLLDGAGLPALPALTDRHVLVVGPAYDAAADLRRLRRYRRRWRPALVGVDGGADVLVRAGLVPDLVVGDPATMSDEALRAAGAVVLRAGAEGLDRVHDLVVPHELVATRAAPEDLALLIAARAGAAVVVVAGVPRSLEELLDRGRAAAASSLTTRVAVAPLLVPARAAEAFVPRRRRGMAALCVLLVCALVGSVAVGHAALWEAWQRWAG
jgi:uncharacterized membrane-anchored protein